MAGHSFHQIAINIWGTTSRDTASHHKPTVIHHQCIHNVHQSGDIGLIRSLPGEIDIGCFLLQLIADLDPDAGAAGDAHEVVGYMLAGEQALEDAGVLLAQETGHADLKAVIRQVRGHIDPFTARVGLVLLDPVDLPGLEIGDRYGLVDGGIEGDGSDFE
jgi:hypothetical protein